MSRSTNLISIATQNTEEKTKLDKLHMLEDAANINIVSLQNKESSTFQKAAKIEVLKHQLESGSSRSNTNFNSNLKYIEATASLEAAANHENAKLISHTTLEEKNDTKNKMNQINLMRKLKGSILGIRQKRRNVEKLKAISAFQLIVLG